MPDFTPRNVTKFVARAAVALKASEIAEDVAVDYVGLNADSKTVDIGCRVVGWYVSSKLEPYTDRLVDHVADKLAAYKANKDAKKDLAETEK